MRRIGTVVCCLLASCTPQILRKTESALEDARTFQVRFTWQREGGEEGAGTLLVDGHKLRYEFASSRGGQKRRESVTCDGARTRWMGFEGRSQQHAQTLANDVRRCIARYGIRGAVYRVSGALDPSQDAAPPQFTNFRSEGSDAVRVQYDIEREWQRTSHHTVVIDRGTDLPRSHTLLINLGCGDRVLVVESYEEFVLDRSIDPAEFRILD